MSRFAAFAMIVSACLSYLHGHELNTEKKTSSAPPGSVKGTAEAGASQSSVAEKIQKTPKKIVISGASVDFFRPAKKSSQARSAGKVRGWQLLNPFAPLNKASKYSRAWEGDILTVKNSRNRKQRRRRGLRCFSLNFERGGFFQSCNFMLGKGRRRLL